MSIIFDKDGFARFQTKHHGEVTLSKWKWDIICGEPERFYYRLNSEKVATTLINPDHVRHHRHIPSQFLYYKAYPQFVLTEGILIPTGTNFPAYFAVVIDTATSKVCTVYPVAKPKSGKEFQGG
jgi:hypothetical protein